MKFTGFRYLTVGVLILCASSLLYFLRFYGYFGKFVDINLSKDGLVMLPVQHQLTRVFVYRVGFNYLCVAQDGLIPKDMEPLHRDAPGRFEPEGLCLNSGGISSVVLHKQN